MNKWFRRRRPAPAPVIPSLFDIRAAHAWGLTLKQWDELADSAKTYCRTHITQAPGFGETK